MTKVIFINNRLTNEQKGIFISFLLHSAVVFFYFLYFYHEIKTEETKKSITLTIENIDTYQQIDTIQQPMQMPIEKTKSNIVPIEQKQIIEEPKPQPIEIPKQSIQPTNKPQEIIKSEPTPIIHEESKKEIIAIQPKAIKIPKAVQKVSEEPNKQTAITQSQPTISKTDFAIIRDKVLSNLVYPNIARRMGWNGVVEVAITIDEKGKFISAKIESSSGRIILDEAGLSAANELKNEILPKPNGKTTIILPISFKLT